MTENKSVNHFFERPFSSSFLFPESLGINNFTSTYPIPIKFKDYKKIILQIQIDISISKEVKIIVKKVGFYYNVDTISLRFCYDCITMSKRFVYDVNMIELQCR